MDTIETIEGTTPAGTKRRRIDLWVERDDGRAVLHMWICSPESRGGYEICIEPQDLIEKLRILGLS